MNIILCPKEKGNTKKLCDAIATKDNWKLVIIKGKEIMDLSGYNKVIFGSGVYAGAPHKNLLSFIRNLKKEYLPKKINIMLTWLGRGKSDKSAFKYIQKECTLKEIPISSDYIKILGHSLGILHIGRPNKDDIKACIKWAKELQD